MTKFLRYQICTICLFLLLLVFSARLHALSFKIYGAYTDSYEVMLLKAALESSLQTDVELVHFEGPFPKARAFQLMESQDAVDIIIAGATPARVAQHQAVHFPIFKGLYGLRVNLVHRDNLDLLKSVENLQQLRNYTIGQFHTWSDTEILQHNELMVASGSDVDGLYEMLHKKRYDVFPRSILEVKRNLDEYQQFDLSIEPHTLIRYPKVHYFFVRKGNLELANSIERGLELLMANGTLDAMFNEHYGELLSSLNIKKRQIIELENPNLPEGVPLERKALWVDVSIETIPPENESR